MVGTWEQGCKKGRKCHWNLLYSLISPGQVAEIPVDETAADFCFGDVDEVLRGGF